jgi:hypothetical protein
MKIITNKEKIMNKLTAEKLLSVSETVLNDGEQIDYFDELGSIMEEGKKTETLIFVITNKRLLAYKQNLKINPITRFIPFSSWFIKDEIFYNLIHEIYLSDIIRIEKSRFGLTDEGCKLVLNGESSYLVWWRKQKFDSMAAKFKQFALNAEIIK